MNRPAPPRWRKSTRSGSESNCVEIAGTLDRVRDSKNAAVVMMVGQDGWSAFLTATKAGEFATN